jgi:uncharacterized protein
MEVEAIFADTNLFLRYLTNDIPDQADAVEALLRLGAAGKSRLITNPLVIAEIVWTLESYYGLTKEAIREKVLAILNTPGLEVVDEEIVLQAIHWSVEKNMDFIDAYNAAWMLKRGNAALRKSARLPGHV